MRKSLALAIWLALAGPASAWGPQGHMVAAAIAAANLTPSARAQATALLGGAPLFVLESSWADEIRADRPETSAWHYVNIALGARAYDAWRDCPEGECVVAQIERVTRVLADRHAPRRARVDALRFLIHLVADVHQPLHASDHNDRGGNDRLVWYRGARFNLHRIWDTDVVAALGRDPLQVAERLNAPLTPQQKAQAATGTPRDWANQSFAVAKGIYAALPPNDVLPGDYARRQAPLTRAQLTRAGLRLAAIVNRILR